METTAQREREYPRHKYHPTKHCVVVRSAEEEAALGPEWRDNPREWIFPELYAAPSETEAEAEAFVVTVRDEPAEPRPTAFVELDTAAPRRKRRMNGDRT